jgi:hypothetical protein
MCQDCNPIESNTGVIHYSGPDLVICNGNTITNGELLTSVIAKIDNCIGALQFELDVTGLVENSPCINLTKTSLQTVLQSILNTESAYCTQLQTLNTQLTALQTQVNNLPGNKVINITACDPSRVQVTSDTATQKNFKINGLVPLNTILPYFGSRQDFSASGLGFSNGPAAGWAIANGQSHTIGGITYTTIDARNNFIRFGDGISTSTTPSGNNNVTLNDTNIPPISFTSNANFNVTGTTNSAGNHRHITRNMEDVTADPISVSGTADGDLPVRTSNKFLETGDGGVYQASQMGYNGLHSHTISGTATGTITGSSVNNNVQSISVVPVHLQAIPIQWLGCS